MHVAQANAEKCFFKKKKILFINLERERTAGMERERESLKQGSIS